MHSYDLTQLIERTADNLELVHRMLHKHGFAAQAETYGVAEPLPLWRAVQEAEGPSGRPRLLVYCRQQDDWEFLTITLDIPTQCWKLRYETGEVRARGQGVPHLIRLLKVTPLRLPR